MILLDCEHTCELKYRLTLFSLAMIRVWDSDDVAFVIELKSLKLGVLHAVFVGIRTVRYRTNLVLSEGKPAKMPAIRCESGFVVKEGALIEKTRQPPFFLQIDSTNLE